MNLFATAPDAVLWLLAAILVAAAVQDSVQLKISNLLTVAVLVLAVVAAGLSGPGLHLWQNLAVFALVLTVGTVMFARNILGGGDVKLIAAVSLWTDFGGALKLLASILIFGGLLALLILVARLAAPASWPSRVAVLRPKAGIPYGIAIAIGTLFVLAVSEPDRPPPVYVPKGVTIQR